MIRRPPRATLDRSSAASDVYKRQRVRAAGGSHPWSSDGKQPRQRQGQKARGKNGQTVDDTGVRGGNHSVEQDERQPVSYTHLRAHETVLDIVCRLLLELKKR